MINLLAKVSTISFPGLGIGEFEVSNIAVPAESLGFLKNIFGSSWQGIAWYGIIIMTGIILSALYGIHRAHQEGITTDDMLDVILVAVVSSVLGARLYYVVFYGGYDSFSDIIAIWKGGLAIYGAVIGGIISLVIMSKIKKIKPLVLLDIGASSIILGQAIGRWGNFMNIEAYGAVTDLPWRMCSPKIATEMLFEKLVSAEQYTQMLDGTLGVHPTFLYESLWNIIGFFVIWYLYNHKKYHGQMFLTYLAWYGLGRMIVEGLRTDSLWLIPGAIRISQLVGALCFVGCTAVIIYIEIKRRKATATVNETVEAKTDGNDN